MTRKIYIYTTKKGINIWVLFALILINLLPAGSQPVFAQSVTPSFSARITENQVHGYQWPLDASVTLTIDGNTIDTQTVVVADWDPNQTFVRFDAALELGQVIEMTDGNVTKTLTVTNLVVTGVDPDNDTVSGTADPGTQIDIGHIYCDGNACYGFRREYADSNGDWLADFSVAGEDDDEQDIIDIQPGTGSEARQCDEDGDCTQYGWYVLNPYVEAAPYSDWVHAREWPLGTLITMEIDDPSDGIGAMDGDGNPVDYSDTATMEQAPWNPDAPNDIVADFRWPDQFAPGPGYAITMSGDGQAKTLTVSQLNMTGFDLDADTISGIATPGAQIQVCANVPDRCITRWLMADGSGNWTANYQVPGTGNDDPDTFDVQPGSDGWAAEYEEDSDRTWFDWHVDDPRIEVSYEHDWIQIRDFTPGGEVTYTIFDHEGGHALFGPVTGPVDSHGDGWISYNLHHTDLIPGNYITAVNEATGEEVSILIRDLNLDYVGADDDRAFGTAEPNTTIEMNVSETHDQGFNLSIDVDAAGHWEVDLAAEGHPIDSSRHADIRLYDAEGDSILAQPPRIHSQVRSDNFSVDNFSKNADVTLTLYDTPGGAILYGPVTLRTDGSGNAWVNLLPFGIDLVPGNFIVAYDHTLDFTKSLKIEPFTFEGMNTAEDYVYGTSAVGEWVDLHVESLFSNWGLDALTDETGHWTRDYGVENYDITDQMWAYGWAVDDQNNWSEDHTTGLPNIEASIAGDWISGFNFSPDRQVRISFYDDEGGNLIKTFQVTAGGDTQFYASYWDHGVDLQAGMYLLVEDLETGKSSELTLAPLTFDAVDYGANTAWGRADPGAQVVVRANHLFESHEITVIANSDGEWFADFSPEEADLTAEWDLQALLFDPEFDATVAGAPKPPELTASLDGDWISGENWTPSQSVSIDIYETEGGQHVGDTINWSTDNYGSFYAELGNAGTDLLPGYHIVVEDNVSGVIKATTLPNLTIDYLDPDLDVAGGQAPSDTRLSVDFNNQQESIQFDLFSETDGNWEADFAAHDFDLQPGSQGNVRLTDEDGDATQVDGYVPNPTFAVRVNSNWVEANEWELDASLTLEIDDPDNGPGVDYTDTQTVGEAPWDPSQTYVEIQFEGLYDVQPGDVVTLTDGVTSKTHIVTSIEITGYDLESDLVFGVADPNSYDLLVYACDDEYCSTRHVNSDGGGHWTADFGNPGVQDDEQDTYNIIGGTWLDVQQGDADGDFTFFGVGIPNPNIRAITNEDRVDGWQWTEGATATLTIDDPGTPQNPDFSTQDQVGFDEESGQTYVNIGFGGDYDLKPGDIVTLTDGTATKTVTATNVTVTNVNVTTNVVTGTAEPGSQVWSAACQYGSCFQRTTTTDLDGNWSIDFDEDVPGQPSVDIVPGGSVDGEQFDDDGDSTLFTWGVPNPTFGVRVNYDSIEGWEWPLGTTVTIEIDDPTTSDDPEPIYATVGIADWDPSQTYFSLNIENYDLKTGDIVTVTDGNTTKQTITTNLEITEIDAETDIVYGVAPPLSQINVWVCDDNHCVNREEPVGPSGSWSADFSVPGDQNWEQEIFDIQTGTWVDSANWDSDGDGTMYGQNVTANQAPIAEANGPYTGNEGETIALDASGSSDPDNNIVSYEWDLDNDGQYDDATGITTEVTFGDDGSFIVGLRVVDEFGESDTATAEVTVNNLDPESSADPLTQTVQYSDDIVDITFTASDVAGDVPQITATEWNVDGGGSTNGLPGDLTLEANGCSVSANANTCTWTLSGVVSVRAGEYTISITAEDEDGGISTSDVLITVLPEDATVAFDENNPVAVKVREPGGSSGSFSLTVLASETRPDLPASGSRPGDISNAAISMDLVPVGPGGTVAGTCTQGAVSGVDYDAILPITCNFDEVPVNTYTVQAVIGGGYYDGYGEDVLVVYDPSLGFTTGGGWFYWPETGERTNFGYTMKYNKKGQNVKGSLLLIRHMADGSIYRVKSNALYGLALGDSGGFGWASFSGKSTYLEPGWPEPIGNHEFIVYVEDHNEPGTGIDGFWIEVHDKDGNVIGVMSMSREAVDHAAELGGGNVVVPYSAAQ
jgi:hypothetical protein